MNPWEELEAGAGNVLRGMGIAVRALKGVARQAMQPELDALGIPGVDPFTMRGEIEVLKARNRKAAEAQAAKWAAIRAQERDWDRQLRLPLGVRFPELLTEDPDANARPLEHMRAMPEGDLPPERGVKPEDVARHFELLKRGQLPANQDVGSAQ